MMKKKCSNTGLKWMDEGLIMNKQSNDDLYNNALARKMVRALLIVQGGALFLGLIFVFASTNGMGLLLAFLTKEVSDGKCCY
jgi:hypothetical protein